MTLGYSKDVSISHHPRLLLAVAAVVFAVSTIVYSAVWMTAIRRSPDQVEIGFDGAFAASEKALVVKSVIPGGPAEKAGLAAGDRIVALDGHAIVDQDYQPREWSRHKPGDTIQLTIRRPGQAGPITLRATFRSTANARNEVSTPAYFAGELRYSFPVPFVVVGLTLLFLRLESRDAWLLALLLASLTAGQDFPTGVYVQAGLRAFALGYKALFLGMLGALFYWFFAVFPVPSPIERRVPWLKWVGAALGIVCALPGIPSGQLMLPPPLPRILGEKVALTLPLFYVFGFLALGLLSLVTNFISTADPEAHRKIKVIFWGTMVGIAPGGADAAVRSFTGYQPWPWFSTVLILLLFVFPMSFAYAVFKHRVLEIPVLLKMSARYILVQRGFTIFLSLVSIALTLLFAFSFARVAQPIAVTFGAVFGTVLFWGGSQVHRQVSGRIDRAFFRSAYDARVILEDLAQKTGMTTERGQLARLLESHMIEALRPTRLSVELEDEGILAKRSFAPEELVVPMTGRSGRLLGLIVLGERLSEEPYSGEDKRLLASVASQAATALENMRLGEEIAERLETDRRVAREMEIARDVQTRLLPLVPPRLKTLECDARCIQARSVGGDYYDFLDLDRNRIGLVLADVSGKGVHAALLMATLQAHLRSQCGIVPFDPVRVLSQVNLILCRSTATQHFATMFFGVYNDDNRRLAYINCGHNPPVLVSRDGSVRRLGGTATVIGMFESWQCSVAEVEIKPGEVFAAFSDGVTEASSGDEEFGEERLIEALKGQDAGEIVEQVLARVQQFSAGIQSDDLTLLVAVGK